MQICVFFLPEKMKDGVIAKLAAQTEDYYADAMKQMQRENIRGCWEKVRKNNWNIPKQQ